MMGFLGTSTVDEVAVDGVTDTRLVPQEREEI